MLFSEQFYDTKRVTHKINRDICENSDMATKTMGQEIRKLKTIDISYF